MNSALEAFADDRMIERENIRDEDCLECHGVKGYSVPVGKHGETRKRALDINADALRESVHGKFVCLDCHEDIRQLPHSREGLQAVDCVTCHISLRKASAPERVSWLTEDEAEIVIQTKHYTHSVHAGAEIKTGCANCHTAHYVYPSADPKAVVHRLNSPEMCGKCHEKALQDYRMSIHGAALKTPWRGESATCSDCHSSHRISESEQVAAHRVVTKQCGNCHKKEVDSYMFTTHGQLAWLGNKKAAKCSDCHQAHTTHKADDPEALISEKNRLGTCRKCHENAEENFTEFHAHGNVHDYKNYPELWWTGRIMAGVVLVVLVFFYTHSMLWFHREIKSRPITWITIDSKSYPVRTKKEKHRSGQHFRRFSWGWRLNHWALALSVMTLVFTGMTVMYPGAFWASMAVELSGGTENFAIAHRIAAVIFLLAVFGHLAAVLFHVIRKGDFEWFGPDSLLPRKQDFWDMAAQFRWFFGKGEQPRFDRWTYWEKFDYWAVYWGAFVIGLSGMILWFSDYFSRIFPGWAFNLATLFHGIEAFLAVMTLFVVHFFNNHFRPGKFPLDTVMFTGSWDLEEFKEERPEEYARLAASGELEKHMVKPPSRRADIISYILGFSLLGIGLGLLVLVIIGFSQKGLV
ncbi:MAG: cytochrome C [Gammaproteobacteria bacterium]|nr:cytochrome C [Gammaproteobacteria bacterium]